MSTPRETQFAKFAALLWDELLGKDRYIDVSTGYSSALDPEDDDHKKYIEIIAKRVYDLACRILSDIGGATGDLLEAEIITPQEVLAGRPHLDLAAWPKESEEEDGRTA